MFKIMESSKPGEKFRTSQFNRIVGFSSNNAVHLVLDSRNYGLTIEDEFQLDDGIISGSFDNTFDMGLVGTLSGSIWYICWRTDRSNTRLLASHTEQITDVLPIEETHLVTSSLDGTIRVFQIDDRNEILRFNADGLVSAALLLSNLTFLLCRKSPVWHHGRTLSIPKTSVRIPTQVQSKI